MVLIITSHPHIPHNVSDLVSSSSLREGLRLCRSGCYVCHSLAHNFGLSRSVSHVRQALRKEGEHERLQQFHFRLSWYIRAEQKLNRYWRFDNTFFITTACFSVRSVMAYRKARITLDDSSTDDVVVQSWKALTRHIEWRVG